MRRLFIGMRAVDDTLCEDFKKEFNVNLDSEKYAKGKLEEKWNLLIQDCTVSKSRESWSEYIHLFEEKFYNVLNKSRLVIRVPKKVSNLSNTDEYELGTVIRDEKTQEEIERKNKAEFRRLIDDFVALLDNYWIYETDVWLNAWLVIKYREAQKQREGLTEKCMSGNTEGGTVLNDKGEEYRLPFEDDEDIHFVSVFFDKIIGKKGCLFWTELGKDEDIKIPEYDENDINSNILSRADIKLKRTKDYSTFGYKKIQKLEADMDIEEKILLHKTVNGILLRNMINKMFDNKSFEVEDYVDLIDKLCGCKSLVWQNLIGCIYVLFDKYKVELDTLDFYGDVYLLLSVWLIHIKTINYRVRILTEGFLYLYEKNECDEKYMAKKCEECLLGLELEINDSAINYWNNQSDKLKVFASVLENHNDYCWIYAILQRRAIDTIKSLYRDDKFIEEPQESVIRIHDGNKIVEKKFPYKIVGPDRFQVDYNRITEEISKWKKETRRKTVQLT